MMVRSYRGPLVLLASILVAPGARAADGGDSAPTPASNGVDVSVAPEPLSPDPSPKAPGAPAVATPWDVAPIIDVIAQYTASVRTDEAGNGSWYHEFDVPRAQLGSRVAYGEARATVLVEAVRSTSGGSLVGVAGDSLVLRVRNAFVGYRIFGRLELRGGVLPTLMIPGLEQAWGLRVLGPMGLERSRLSSPADLGMTAHTELPGGFGSVAVGATNGEGYTGRELNRGKNVEVMADVRPLAHLRGVAAPLSLRLGFVSGSSGPGRARADRLTVGLTHRVSAWSAGVVMTYARGVEDDGGKRALLLDSFLRVEPWRRLLLGGHVTHEVRNLALSHDHVTEVTVAAGGRPVDPCEALVAFDTTLVGDSARTTLPALDSWRVRAVARFHLE